MLPCVSLSLPLPPLLPLPGPGFCARGRLVHVCSSVYVYSVYERMEWTSGFREKVRILV